jgi:hypothetical protein
MVCCQLECPPAHTHTHLTLHNHNHNQASLAASAAQLQEARAAAERDLAAAISDTKARAEADLQARSAEWDRALGKVREDAAAAGVERERVEGERARAATLERLEWMKERQAAEEGTFGVWECACLLVCVCGGGRGR